MALFFSERWWRENFRQNPPGLIGAGTGLPLGEFYIGPYGEISDHRAQHASTGAYTRRDFSGFWDYYPDSRAEEDRPEKERVEKDRPEKEWPQEERQGKENWREAESQATAS